MLARLRKTVADGSIIVGAGAGKFKSSILSQHCIAVLNEAESTRYRTVSQSRRERRLRPDLGLQFWSIPHGRPGFTGRADAILGREPGRCGDGIVYPYPGTA